MKTYFDIRGDGGSRVLEQVVAQRQRVAERLRGVRHVLAVGSGKGGVGKSTLTAQLGAALAAGGDRVAILDADLNGPSQARLGGIRPGPPIPGPEGLEPSRTARGIGVVSLGSVLEEGRALEFDSVARGDSQVWRATREFTLFFELLAAVRWAELEVLLVDLPPGAERTVQFAEALGPSTGFLLVTVPSDLSRGVVARSISALAGTASPILGYVENMSGYYCDRCRDTRPLFPTSGSVELAGPCLARIPFDPELAALCDRGGSLLEELPPERPAVRALVDLAATVRRLLSDLPPASEEARR